MEVLTRNDQLTLKAGKYAAELEEAAAGSAKGGKGKRGKGKGGKGRGGRGKGGKGRGKKGKGGKGKGGRGRGGRSKTSPDKAEVKGAVKTRAGAFKNKKRARATKVSPKKGRKACKISKQADVLDDGVDNALCAAAALKEVDQPCNTKRVKTRKPRKVTKPKPEPSELPEASEVNTAKASKKRKAASKAAPSKPSVEEPMPEQARKPPRGRRGQKVKPAAKETDETPSAIEWPNSFARRACPPNAGTEAWHLWRIIVQVFLEKIAPKITDRSRTRKEVSGL